MSPSGVDPGRLRLVTGLLAAGFLAAVLGQARVQIFEREAILAKARQSSRFFVEKTLPAKRGTIFSSDGLPLAEDWDAGELRVNSNHVPLSPAFFVDLSTATGIAPSEIQALVVQRRGTRSPGIVWRKPIGMATVAAVESVRARWRADGVSVARGGVRHYPLGSLAGGIVGYVREGKGDAGIEQGFEDVLAGRDGFQSGIIDRRGEFLTKGVGERREPRNGQPIVLTVDSQLQRAAALAVRKAVEENDADSGVAVVLDPKTGDVLAMANWPSWSPGEPYPEAGGRRSSALVNPAVSSVFEPGSTFKALTLALALDAEALTTGTTVYCSGSILVGKRRISCDHHGGSRAHGVVTPEIGIAKSCNVAAATWALRVGYPRYVEFLEKLGLLDPPGIGFAKEAKGYFRKDEPAKQLQLATLGFGQSISAVPVSLAAAFAMLGNHGVLVRPRIVRRIGEREMPVRTAGQVVSPAAADATLRIMESVFENPHGTAAKLRLQGYLLAGKTGTAQKVGAKTKGYVSNFVGFVPARDPRALVLVMVDNPRKAYYGAAVAGPVFIDIAEAIIQRFGIPPDRPAGPSAARPAQEVHQPAG